MAEMALVKIQGVLVAGNDETNERLTRLKAGDVLRGDFKKARNPKFHRKFFALLDIGYDSWEPGELDTKLGVPEKNRNRFRGQVTVLAGYYDVAFNLDGSPQLIPKSISFANMTQTEFEELYSAVANVLLVKVLGNYTRDDLDNRVAQILDFV